MRIETTSLRPKLGTFIKYFVLTIISLFILRTAVNVIFSPDAFTLNPFGWLSSLIILAFGTSVGVTFGARRFQLIVAGNDDIKKINGWTLHFLSNRGLRIKDKNESETTFEPGYSYNRLLNSWFGTELVFVKQADNKLIIEGPFRLIDSVETKLKFEKS